MSKLWLHTGQPDFQLWSVSLNNLYPFPHTERFCVKMFHPQGDCLILTLSWIHPVTVDSPSAYLHPDQVTLSDIKEMSEKGKDKGL